MRKSIIWSFEKDFLQNSLNESYSYDEFFNKLKLKTSKSLIKVLQYRFKIENIDRTLFRENTKKKRLFKELPLDDILVENSKYTYSVNLKKKLLKHNLLEYKCYVCDNPGNWNGKVLSLQLDHINGISNDNRLCNLRLLCPNCHSQTDTYAGKKNKIKSKKHLIECKKCKTKVDNKVLCNACDAEIKFNRRKVERPDNKVLLDDVNLLGYSATGRKYGVSDNTIRKWLKYGVVV